MRRVAAWLLAALVLPPLAAADPLGDEIARARAVVAAFPASDAFAADVRGSVEPLLARAADALAAGRRHQALQLYAQAYEMVGAGAALVKKPAAERNDLAAFEAQWRAASALRARVAVPPVRPALARALAEAAAGEAPVLYDASLDYGRSTTPDSGFYYLEAARAEAALVSVLAGLAGPTAERPLVVRDIAADIDALRAELLAAYVPPASLDRHGEFIAASAALKEARELNAAGLHHGALLKYLQGAQRLGRLREPRASAPAVVLPKDVDGSLIAAFLEAADEARGSSDPERRRNAHAVTDVVVPAYLRAIAPAAMTATAKADPPVTVTLVRWPYT